MRNVRVCGCTFKVGMVNLEGEYVTLTVREQMETVFEELKFVKSTKKRMTMQPLSKSKRENVSKRKFGETTRETAAELWEDPLSGVDPHSEEEFYLMGGCNRS